MSRFNFFARSGNNDPYSDRAPLSPRIQVIADDIEAQPSAATATAAAAAPGTGGLRASAEMTERLTPSSRFLSRFRPTIPSFFTTASNTTAAANNNQPPPQGIPVPLPRPSSSHYSSDYSHIHSNPYTLSSTSYAYSSSLSSLSGTGPTNNHTNHTAPTDDDEDDIYNASPKSPEFRIRAQNLPSTRLHLPELERTWTQGSNGPPTRPGTGTREGGDGLVAEPAAAVVRERGHGRRHAERRRERDGHGHSRSRSGSGSGSGRSGGRERRRRGHRRDGSGSGSRSRSGSGSGSRSGSSRSGSGESRRRRERERRRRGHGSRGSESTRERRPPPKNFLFCFPWIKSRRIRSQILRCFVSGTFLVLMLAVCKWFPAVYSPKEMEMADPCRPLPLPHQKHQLARVHRPPHPHHPRRHHLLLPRARAPLHARRQGAQARAGRAAGAAGAGDAWDRQRRVRGPERADPRRAGPRRGGRGD